MRKTKRRIVALLVSVMAALCLMPAVASAEEATTPQADVAFTVYVQKGDATATVAKAYTADELSALATSENVGALYYKSNAWHFYGTSSYIPMSTLLENAGVSFISGDTFVVSDPTGFTYEGAYQDVNGELNWYPATTASAASTDGAQEIGWGIGLNYVKMDVTTTAGADLTTALAKETTNGTMYLMGATEEDYTTNPGNIAGNRLIRGANSITIKEPASSSFTIYTQNGSDASTKTAVKTYTASDLTALAAKNTTARGFLYSRSGWQIIGADNYVTLDQLLSGAGVTFAAGDKLIPAADDGYSYTYTYSDLNAAKYFYPATTASATSTDGKVEVDAVLALDYASTAVKTTAGADLKTALASAHQSEYRFLCGLSDENYESTTAAGKRFVTAPVSITIVKGFSDVDYSAWYADYVAYASENSLMTGYTGTTKFGVGDNITRGQVATILYRYACTLDSTLEDTYGSTTDSAKYAKTKVFDDEATGVYYTAAINWAKAVGIMTGDSSSNYKTVRPDANVTREEFAVLIARYAKSAGKDTSMADSTKFFAATDWNTVDGWAAPSLIWTSANDVLGGFVNADKTTTLKPTDPATREQAAKIITVLVRDVLSS